MVFDMLVVVLLVHRDLFAHLICMRNGGMAGLFEALVDKLLRCFRRFNTVALLVVNRLDCTFADDQLVV